MTDKLGNTIADRPAIMADPDYKRLWLQACDAYDRKNPSGCVCKLDPDTDALLGVCGLHADWLQTKLAEERERIARWLEGQGQPGYAHEVRNGAGA